MNLFELYLSLTGYNLAKARKYLHQLEHEIETAGLEVYQKKYRAQLYAQLAKNNPFFIEKIKGLNNAEWKLLPMINKTDYQADLSSLISRDHELRDLYIATTSGSSGHPMSFAKNKFCHALAWVQIEKNYGTCGLSLHSKQARFYGIPLKGFSRTKELAKDLIMNRVRFPVFDLSDQNFSKYVNKFKKIKFEYLYGYTSSVVAFAEYLLRTGQVLKEICPSLKCGVVTSEAVSKEEQLLMQEAFGVKVLNEYGASEFGIMAFEMPDGKMKWNAALYYPEQFTFPDGTQTTLISSLLNYAFPFIRYNIGDILHFHTENNLLLIDDILGRTDDYIHLPSGRKSAGLTFYYISRQLLESGIQIREFCVDQVEPGLFIFNIVSDAAVDAQVFLKIQEALDAYLEPGLKFEIRYVDHIPRLKNGKIKHFNSLLNQ